MSPQMPFMSPQYQDPAQTCPPMGCGSAEVDIRITSPAPDVATKPLRTFADRPFTASVITIDHLDKSVKIGVNCKKAEIYVQVITRPEHD